MVARRGFLGMLGAGAAAPIVAPDIISGAVSKSIGGGPDMWARVGGATKMAEVIKKIPWYKDPLGLAKAAAKRKLLKATMPDWVMEHKGNGDSKREAIAAHYKSLRSLSKVTRVRLTNEEYGRMYVNDWVNHPARSLARVVIEGQHSDMGLSDPYDVD